MAKDQFTYRSDEKIKPSARGDRLKEGRAYRITLSD
jgi:hypothetical protein